MHYVLCLIFAHKDPPPPPEAFFITAYSSPVNHPATEKLHRTVGRSKNTPVLGSAPTELVGHIQPRKENDSGISTSKRSKAFPCVGKENDHVLTSKKSKAALCSGKENDTIPTSKQYKTSSAIVCTSESPNKKQKQVSILINIY